MPTTRACPSHEPAAQQRRSGFSHSTGNPRRRAARSLRWTVDVLLLAVSVGSSASTALPVMPHPSRPTSTLRRRTRIRHRSPPRTGCALFQLTSSPTRTGPARGGAAARGQCCGGSVRTRRTVPGSLRGSGHAQTELPARDLGHGRLPLTACPSPHVATTSDRFSRGPLQCRACSGRGPGRRPRGGRCPRGRVSPPRSGRVPAGCPPPRRTTAPLRRTAGRSPRSAWRCR